MSFNWLEYLTLAEDIERKAAPSEAEVRSAISRSYYAVHNIAAERAEREGFPNLKHASLVSHYKSYMADVNYQEIGRALGGLKIQRHICDYDSDTAKLGNLKPTLSLNLRKAEEVKRRLGL